MSCAHENQRCVGRDREGEEAVSWCEDCGAIKYSDAPTWELPSPWRPVSAPPAYPGQYMVLGFRGISTAYWSGVRWEIDEPSSDYGGDEVGGVTEWMPIPASKGELLQQKISDDAALNSRLWRAETVWVRRVNSVVHVDVSGPGVLDAEVRRHFAERWPDAVVHVFDAATAMSEGSE